MPGIQPTAQPAQTMKPPLRLVPNKPEAGGRTVNGGVNPFVRQLGLKEIEQRDAPPPPPVTDIDEAAALSALAGHVRKSWERNKIAKERIGQNLLADLRARRGVYSPAELADIEASSGGLNIIWAPITDIKSRAGSAWLHDVILPAGATSSGLEPTPMPDLPMPLKNGIVRKALMQAQEVMAQAEAAGGGVLEPEEFRTLVQQLGDKLRADAEKTLKKLAKTRAQRMETVIEDRKAEGNYYPAMSDFLEDFVTYPAAHLKGPIYKRNKTLKWGEGWKPEVTNSAVPWWDRVAPFDCYPAPGSMTPQKGDFIEHMRFQRDELYDLKGLEGFKDDQIDQALMDYSEGRSENWLWTEAERQRLEQETNYMWLSPPGIIDGINFWGRVPGWKLMTYGVKGIEDETRDYECNVLVCGRYVLYAALNPNPLGRRPYRKACYDSVPGAYWGRSIPNLVRTPQVMANGSAMAMANNMGIASGPMMWTHVDRLADGEQSMDVFPWKNMQLKSDPTQGVNPGVGFFQPSMNVEPLWAVYEKWELKADDASGIPRYTYGNERVSGAAATSSGLNTLLGQTAKGLRRAVQDIDTNVTGPTTEDTFINEMLYNPDMSIKGDCRVVARGAAAILIRSEAQQRRLQFLGLTANPFDMEIVGGKYRAALLREVAMALELPVDDVVPSEEEYGKREEAKTVGQEEAVKQQLAIEAATKQQEFKYEAALIAIKEQAIAMREQQVAQQTAQSDLIKSVIETSVQASFDADQAKREAKPPAETKKPKKLKHKFDDAGNLVESELME